MKYLWLFVCLTVVRSQAAIEKDPLAKLCEHEEFVKCGDSNKCFNPRAICDRIKDCGDGSDEANCQCYRKKDCPKGFQCRRDKHDFKSVCVRCAPGEIFKDSSFQCEDINECMDAKKDVCAGKGSCLNRANGYECVECPQGYEASLRYPRLFTQNPVYNQSETFRTLLLCTDHNECAEDNPCPDKACFNRIGGNSCTCPPNHEMRSDVHDSTCQAIGESPLIAIGNENSIVIFDLRSATQDQELRWTEPIVDLSADIGMVIFATRRQVWEYRIAVNSTELLADFGNDEDFSNGDIRKISWDWENHRCYVLTGDSVSVVDNVGRAVKILEHRGNISSIAVDPVAGYLFYSEFGNVRRSYLDGFGESATTVFTALPAHDLESIEALAIDPNLKYVYYIHNRVLYGFDYNGYRAAIIRDSADFTHLEPFEDLLYATYRNVVSDSLVTLGRSGYSIGDPPESTVKSFRGTLPKSMAIIQGAKFPTRPKELNSCLKQPCSFDWCFPMPPSRTPSYHCDCGASMRGNCLPLKTHHLKPVPNDLLPNEEKMSVTGSSVPITAHTTKVGIIIPIILVLLMTINLSQLTGDLLQFCRR